MDVNASTVQLRTGLTHLMCGRAVQSQLAVRQEAAAVSLRELEASERAVLNATSQLRTVRT